MKEVQFFKKGTEPYAWLFDPRTKDLSKRSISNSKYDLIRFEFCYKFKLLYNHKSNDPEIFLAEYEGQKYASGEFRCLSKTIPSLKSLSWDDAMKWDLKKVKIRKIEGSKELSDGMEIVKREEESRFTVPMYSVTSVRNHKVASRRVYENIMDLDNHNYRVEYRINGGAIYSSFAELVDAEVDIKCNHDHTEDIADSYNILD